LALINAKRISNTIDVQRIKKNHSLNQVIRTQFNNNRDHPAFDTVWLDFIPTNSAFLPVYDKKQQQKQ